MKKTTIKMTAACFMLIATLGSCVKGDKGAAGTNGTNGTNGNANVHAGTISVGYSDWTYTSSSWTYYFELTDNSITQDVVDNGTVSVFLSSNGGTSWQAIPMTVYINTTESYSFGFKYYLNGATLFLTFSDASTITSSYPTYTFKLVAVGGAQRQANPHTNWNNYNEVQAALGSSMVEKTLPVSAIH